MHNVQQRAQMQPHYRAVLIDFDWANWERHRRERRQRYAAMKRVSALLQDLCRGSQAVQCNNHVVEDITPQRHWFIVSISSNAYFRKQVGA